MSTNKANRLANEKSPYLLQHAHNPVDWFPWSEEAFTKAKSEDKPIFLSIGYSTCHWCHVMERESFEDEEVAGVLNTSYIAIKVDREERPDLDHLYMTFCQAMTGQGGWPLTVIMTPEKKPFFAGTYFPKESRGGLPGLIEILAKVAQLWQTERDKLVRSGEELTVTVFQENLQFREGQLTSEVIEEAYRQLEHRYDPVYGGFGHAPKFPVPHNLTFLLRYYVVNGEKKALEMVERTLVQMYKGGIFDHIGFGFSRYSTDKKWLVPHFEKMLYDNALLAIAYLEAYQLTQKRLYREVAEKIFTYVLNEMTSPEGAFYSAEDADSEGVEGKFYLWSPGQVVNILGAEAGREYCRIYDITERGNFENGNIPNLIDSTISEIEYETTKVGEKSRTAKTSGTSLITKMEEYRQKLAQVREKRVRPFRDDKILTAWNGLMIAALAKGARVLDSSVYQVAAEKAAAFIYEKLRRKDGRLLARYREGEAAYPAYLDDYAFMVWALLELYDTTYQPDYLAKAISLNRKMLELFWDSKKRVLYLTGKDSEELLIRPRDSYDGAVPAGNSVAALNLLRLAALIRDYQLEETVEQLFSACGREVTAHPMGYTFFLQAYLYAQIPTRKAVIAAEKGNSDAQEMINILQQNFLPYTVSLYLSPEKRDLIKQNPFLKEFENDYQALDGRTTAYICQNRACHAPIRNVEDFKKIVKDHEGIMNKNHDITQSYKGNQYQ